VDKNVKNYCRLKNCKKGSKLFNMGKKVYLSIASYYNEFGKPLDE
jgi:hypothetical protein